jgi:hypothetical protein
MLVTCIRIFSVRISAGKHATPNEVWLGFAQSHVVNSGVVPSIDYSHIILEQKWVPGIFLGVNGGRRVRLNSPPSVNWLSRENVGASTSHNSMASTTCYRIYFTFTVKSSIKFWSKHTWVHPYSPVTSYELIHPMRVTSLTGVLPWLHALRFSLVSKFRWLIFTLRCIILTQTLHSNALQHWVIWCCHDLMWQRKICFTGRAI